MEQSILRRRLKGLLLINTAAVAAAGLYALLGRFGIGFFCVFRRITGLMCPGCGNSRAVQALLRLELKEAFAFNLLFPLEIGYLAWVWIHCCIAYVRRGRFQYTPPWPAVDICALIVIVLWGIVRNLI